MKLIVSLLVVGIIGLLVAGSEAAGDKEVVLKGKIMCARCELKDKSFKGCQTVIEVQEGGKAVLYYFKDKGHDEEIRSFVAACEQGGPLPIPLDQLALTSKVTFAVIESLRRGSAVALET